MPDPIVTAASPGRGCGRMLRHLRRALGLFRGMRSTESLADLTPAQLEDFDMPEDLRRSELARRAWEAPRDWHLPGRGL